MYQVSGSFKPGKGHMFIVSGVLEVISNVCLSPLPALGITKLKWLSYPTSQVPDPHTWQSQFRSLHIALTCNGADRQAAFEYHIRATAYWNLNQVLKPNNLYFSKGTMLAMNLDDTLSQTLFYDAAYRLRGADSNTFSEGLHNRTGVTGFGIVSKKFTITEAAY